MSREPLIFNGVNGATGEYGLPPMTGEELAAFICGEAQPDNLNELRARYRAKNQSHYGVKEGVDPKKLAEAGWGVIFAHDVDPAIVEALAPLLAHRQGQAGDRYRMYTNDKGFRRPDDTKNKFLARHGMGPGPADPERVPYYLLIVGSPADIPFKFQYELDVQYAVGRIDLATPEEYADYAASVVAVERGGSARPRRAEFFGARNGDDGMTKLSAEELVAPLAGLLAPKVAGWQFGVTLGPDAHKARLGDLLGGPATPALLFTAGHGMEFPLGDQRQIAHQGALLCSDWGGPNSGTSGAAIPHDYYFAGEDLAASADLRGLIAFFFACYSLGMPEHDDFARQAFKQRLPVAPYPFSANLPRRMLARPGRGALAVVGHIERAWGFSFHWPDAGRQLATFESTLQRLLEGHPVGSALDYVNERYAELSTMLSNELDDIKFGKSYDPYELADLWTANHDARNFVLFGDPAVRL